MRISTRIPIIEVPPWSRLRRQSMAVEASSAAFQRCWNPDPARWDPEVEILLSNSLTSDRLEAISAASCLPPLLTCLRVNTLRTTPEEVLQKLEDALSPSDRSLLLSSPRKPFVHPLVPNAVLVPGSGPYSVDYSRTQGREVIVGRKAGESMLRGSNAYAPGILACTSGIAKGDVVAVSIGVELAEGASGISGGLFGCSRGTVLPPHLPLDDPRFPNRGNLFIGVGRAEVSRTGMNPSAEGLVVTMIERVFRTPALGEVLKGEVVLQNLPSLVTAWVANPQPGQRVLDMCAAPGNKTTAMATLMEDKGEVIALDRSHAKVQGIKNLCHELGITCVKAFRADSTRLTTDPQRRRAKNSFQEAGKRISEEALQRELGLNDAARRRRDERKAALRAKLGHKPEKLPDDTENLKEPLSLESFDVVLLDAPCSALGLRPRLLSPHSLKELRSTASYQRRLLDQAVQLVKPGGTLVFSTCTISPLENEANVRYMLECYPDHLDLEPQSPYLGGPGLVGEVHDGTGIKRQLLRPSESDLVQRFDPSGELDSIGFFVAKFKKKSSLLQ